MIADIKPGDERLSDGLAAASSMDTVLLSRWIPWTKHDGSNPAY